MSAMPGPRTAAAMAAAAARLLASIEHDNTQDAGHHIHSVWRNPAGDFGDDILAEHYRLHH